MAVGLPLKTTYANGDVYSASDVNDTNGTINLVAQTQNFYAGKNAIINGNFGIWQRGTSFTTNGAYTADRFVMGFGGTGTAQTVSQQTFTPGTAPVSGYESQFFCRNAVTGGTGTSSLVVLTQKIEDVRTFAGQTVTISFWAKANSGTPSIGIDLYQEFGSGGSSTVSNGGTKVAITTSWARYSSTISLASITGKTVGNGSLLGARLWFSSGSDYNSLNGTLGLQSNTFDIWGLQVEAGSTATAFETATGTIQGELEACQRYYYRSAAGTNNNATLALGFVTSTTTNARVGFNLPSTMRTNPTAVDFSTLRVLDSAFSSATVNSITLLSAEQGQNVAFLELALSTGLTAHRSVWLSCNGSGGYVGVSAEL